MNMMKSLITLSNATPTNNMLLALARCALDAVTADWEAVKVELAEECAEAGLPSNGSQWEIMCLSEWDLFFGPTLEWLDKMVTGEIPIDREEVVGLLACH